MIERIGKIKCLMLLITFTFVFITICYYSLALKVETEIFRLNMEKWQSASGITTLSEKIKCETTESLPSEVYDSDILTKPGCSAFAITMTDRGPIVGNTGDDGVLKHRVFRIEKLNYKDSFRILRCMGAGINEMGLAIGTSNAHYAGKTRVGDGDSNDLSIVTLRYCPDVPAAVNFIRDYKITDDGCHFVMTDINETAAAVEKGPGNIFNVRWAKSHGSFDKVVWVTNVPQDPALRTCWDWVKYGKPSSIHNSDDRYENLKSIFTDPNFEYTFKSVENVLFNHNTIGAVCQHGDIYPHQSYTTRTRIILPSEGRLLLAARVDPNQKEWRPCKIGWIAQDAINIKKKKSEREIAIRKVVLPRLHP
jgi:hypothetical protein